MLDKREYINIEVDKIDDNKLVGVKMNSLDEFMLTLAFIYNDLKDLHIMYLGFKKSPLPKAELNAYTGEYHGLDNHYKRLIIGAVFETLEFFRVHRKKMEYGSIKKYISLAPPYINSIWDEFKNAVDDKKSKGGSLKKLLCQIRANITFHYNQSHGVLGPAYKDFFNRKDMGVFNKKAYYSIGSNMQSTRFYYADAAAQEYMQSIMKQFSEFDEEFLELLKKLSHVFSYILKGYIEERKRS